MGAIITHQSLFCVTGINPAIEIKLKQISSLCISSNESGKMSKTRIKNSEVYKSVSSTKLMLMSCLARCHCIQNPWIAQSWQTFQLYHLGLCCYDVYAPAKSLSDVFITTHKNSFCCAALSDAHQSVHRSVQSWHWPIDIFSSLVPCDLFTSLFVLNGHVSRQLKAFKFNQLHPDRRVQVNHTEQQPALWPVDL